MPRHAGPRLARSPLVVAREESPAPAAPVRRGQLWALAVLVVVVLGGWILLHSLGAIAEVFLLTFIGVLLSMILRYPVDFLARWMPRALALLVTLVIVGGALAGLVRLLIPIVAQQLGALVDSAPRALDRVQQWWHDLTGSGGALHQLGGEDLGQRLSEQLQSHAAALLGRVVPIVFGTVSALGAIVLVIALGCFLAYAPQVYVEGIAKLAPPRYERDVRDVIAAMGRTLRGWTRGVLIGMSLTGVLTALGLWIVGVDSWLALGVIMFFGDFIPFIGPVLAALPGLAMALAESPATAAWALVVYLGVQHVESNLIQPLVMKHAVKLAPAVLLVGQILFTIAFGFLGLVVATPLLACLQVGIQIAYVEKALGKRADEAPAAAEHPEPGGEVGHGELGLGHV